jgi:hypothetical protein
VGGVPAKALKTITREATVSAQSARRGTVYFSGEKAP